MYLSLNLFSGHKEWLFVHSTSVVVHWLALIITAAVVQAAWLTSLQQLCGLAYFILAVGAALLQSKLAQLTSAGV
jgi:hypothetical protein